MSSTAIPKSIFLSVATFLSCFGIHAAEGKSGGVQIKEADGKLDISINGKPFTEYHFKNVSRPFFYPVLGPGELPMTRNWPMKDVPNEEHDHPHHKSLWWAHGEMNGVDFWAEGKDSGKTVHDKFVELKSGKDFGVIHTRDHYETKHGKTIATDERIIKIYNVGDDLRQLDFQITLHPADGPLIFGDTKEGTMSMRLAETMRFKGKVGKGHIINSEGVKDDATWGKRAKWCDYYGPVEGKTVGVAIFDHPSNPRFPTWWHVRDYGLFGANPFGVHDFEKKPAGAGDLTVPPGQAITFRYRFYFHPGDEKEGKVAEKYEEWAKMK